MQNVLKPHRPVYLLGPSAALGEVIMTNEDLVAWMNASIRPSWIEHRTGIKTRHWVRPEQSCSHLAEAACEHLFATWQGRRETLSQLIVCTISGDYLSPPTAPLLQDRLKLNDIGAFDLGAACAGFVTGLHVATAMVTHLNNDILLVASDIRSKFLNKRDISATALFGDGAAAAVITTTDAPGNTRFEIKGAQLFADGSIADIISIPAGGSREPAHSTTDTDRFFLVMKQGSTLFLKAVEGMASSAEIFLSAMGVTLGEIDWVVPHQANLHLVREVTRRLGVNPEKVIETVQRYGNTAGSSVGIALNELVQRKQLKTGDNVLLVSAGGGGLAACALLQTRREDC